MTLNVSLQVPDGIVIASDSLLTLSQPITQKMNVQGKCPSCGDSVEIKDVQVPPVSVPSSTFPYSQKLFDVKGRFALAVYGWAFVNGRSMYNHVADLNARLPNNAPVGDYLQHIADETKAYFENQLRLQMAATGTNIDLQLDDWFPFGFQLAGFTKDANGEPISKVYNIQIGKKSAVTPIAMPAFCTGDTNVVALLWPKGNAGANFAVFSLQDAIDYTKFLIRTMRTTNGSPESCPVSVEKLT